MDPSSVSVIVEWENILLAEKSRGSLMIERLTDQLTALPAGLKTEVLILYDQSQINLADLKLLIREDAGVLIIFVDSGPRHYYEIKNFGAQKASGDVLIFLDSDVIPEENWLKNLITSFREKEVDVVCGRTFLEYGDLYSRSFALFWFFPLVNTSTGLRKTKHFFANNVAFKREIFLSNPFPPLAQMRGQCRLLSEQLTDKGIGIYIQEGSRVSHPPPHGLHHFVKRGIAYGYDAYLKSRREGNFLERSPLGSIVRAGGYFSRALFRIIKYHRSVGLNSFLLFIPIVIALAFYGLMFVGEVMTMISPEMVRRNFWV